MVLPGGMSWSQCGLKYLGIFLGNESTNQKNSENVCENVEGRLERWKWLLPKMSFRGRTLIIKNLVAYSLWHRLTVLEPPVGILEKIQIKMTNFFGDKLHWVPRAVLYLPKEEGGQGIVDFKSRKAACKLQFVQKFLYKSNLSWTGLTFCLLSKVGG